MAKKTRTELSTLALNTNLPDNTTELITPTTERAQLTDERESVVNYKDDLGGVPNAGKFLTVAIDGESLTMVDEPSGVPDWVTFQTAAINLMKLLSGSTSGELQFLYDDAGVDTLGARISWSSTGNLIIGNNFFTAELSISNQFNFIQGGAVKLRIETTGDLTHNADIMALKAQQSFGSNPLYTLKFQGKVTGPSGGSFTFEEFANIKGGKENATENDKAGYLSFTTGIADGTLTERLRISSTGAASFSSTITNNVYTTAGSVATPFFNDVFLLGTTNSYSKIQWGNEFNSTYGTYLRFIVNGASNFNTPVTALTIKPSGVLQANYGISFPNGGATTLDAYEEDTYSPILKGASTAGSSPTGDGTYTVIGNVCHLNIRFSGVTVTGAAGAIGISLPFAGKSGATGQTTTNFNTYNVSFTGTNINALYVSGDFLYGLSSVSGTTWADWAIVDASNIYWNLSITYLIN